MTESIVFLIRNVPQRRDGLAQAGKIYRVPQAGPRQPTVAGQVVQRGVSEVIGQVPKIAPRKQALHDF